MSVAAEIMPSETESPIYASAVHDVFFGEIRAAVVVVVAMTALVVVVGTADVATATDVVAGSTTGTVAALVGNGPSCTGGNVVTTDGAVGPAAESAHALRATAAPINQNNRLPATTRTIWDR